MRNVCDQVYGAQVAAVVWQVGRPRNPAETLHYIINRSLLTKMGLASGCLPQFTTHKGTWTGTWRKDGTTWVYDYKGMNLDGKKCSGKQLITFENDDHYVSKDVEQVSDGQPQPDIEWHFERKK